MANKQKNTTKKQEVTLNDIYNLVVDLGNRVSALEEKRTKSSTSSSKKSGTGKKSSKSSDDFDYDTYKATAKKLGCLGKRGVWKGCRQFVYAVMNGEMTEKVAKAKVKAWRDEQDW